ncbi:MULTISPECIES: hypothetical protein [unclassified Pseudonocardia]|uniref:hypothetical protein n=1 Tax=unclassified Pseudonocardia TaxID=2619320 RepID=UPI00094AD8A4|nr:MULTISPECIES: hypothetical protein [unclassified Pseudonocardia]
MGAWGTGLFSSDLACDVRDEYRELLSGKVSDEEVETRIIAEYAEIEEDDVPEFWIAFAMTQFKVGRLSSEVRERAARFMANGSDLVRWEDFGPRTVDRRRAVLERVAEQIAGEQSARRTIRREWRYETDLEAGDVLEYMSESGRVALFRVVAVRAEYGRSPLLQRLDFAGDMNPSLSEIEALPNRSHSAQSRYRYAATSVVKYRKRDLDWCDVGFRRLGRAAVRADDERFVLCWELQWDQLSADLEAVLTGAASVDEFARR